MQSIIDSLGSLFFYGTFILSVLTFQSSYNITSAKLRTDIIEQENLVQFAKIVDHDFQKIGFGNSAPHINPGLVDSTQIFFYEDYDNNNAIDSIHYYLSDTTALASTENPHDRILYRKLNNQNPVSVLDGVVYFHLGYFDSTLTEISYSDLSTINGVNKIQAIHLSISIESPYAFENIYAGIAFERSYFPSNLEN